MFIKRGSFSILKYLQISQSRDQQDHWDQNCLPVSKAAHTFQTIYHKLLQISLLHSDFSRNLTELFLQLFHNFKKSENIHYIASQHLQSPVSMVTSSCIFISYYPQLSNYHAYAYSNFTMTTIAGFLFLKVKTGSYLQIL